MSEIFMDAGYPQADDFAADQVETREYEHHWHRDPGSGGKNYGEDFLVPDGSVVVGYGVDHISRINLKHDRPTVYLRSDGDGPFQLPIGVHVGCRLEPGPLWGSGASYKFRLTVQMVSKFDWMVIMKESIQG